MVSEKSLKPTIAILSGPTATGKTDIAIGLVRKLLFSGVKLEIINADSLLFYKGMDIGTAKPERSLRDEIPHHLIDIRNPDQPFTAGEFVKEAQAIIDEIHSRGCRTLIVGGSGFYLKALLYGLWDASPSDPDLRRQFEALTPDELFEKLSQLDPETALRIGKNDRYRIIRSLELIQQTGKPVSQIRESENQTQDPRFALLVVDREKEELDLRILKRTQAMIRDGLIEEVKSLLPLYRDARALQSIGYAQTIAYLEGTIPPGRKLKPGIDGLVEEIVLATKQLVKRQRTWFRSEKASNHSLLDRDLTKLQETLESIYI